MAASLLTIDDRPISDVLVVYLQYVNMWSEHESDKADGPGLLRLWPKSQGLSMLVQCTKKLPSTPIVEDAKLLISTHLRITELPAHLSCIEVRFFLEICIVK